MWKYSSCAQKYKEYIRYFSKLEAFFAVTINRWVCASFMWHLYHLSNACKSFNNFRLPRIQRWTKSYSSLHTGRVTKEWWKKPQNANLLLDNKLEGLFSPQDGFSDHFRAKKIEKKVYPPIWIRTHDLLLTRKHITFPTKIAWNWRFQKQIVV